MMEPRGFDPGSTDPTSFGWRPPRARPSSLNDAAPAVPGSGAASRSPAPNRDPLDPDAPQPEVDADGLVLSRPSRWDLQYDDPMYQSYWWVAMLDPLELADPCWDEATGEPPVRYTDVTAAEHHGRPAWQAVGVPTWSYDARCVCCPLLDSGPAAAKAEQALGDFVDPNEQDEASHVVVLDLQTGICVLTRQVGGSNEGSGHDIRIEAVDVPLPDRAFQSADQH